MNVNIKSLRNQSGQAARGKPKAEAEAIRAAMAKVEDLERQRLAALGAIGAAEQAANNARGDLAAAESNLQRAANELQALCEG